MGADLTPSGSEDQVVEQQRPLLEKSGRDIDNSNDTVVDVENYGSRVFGFNYGFRPCRDLPYAIAFLAFLVVSLAVGILAVVFANPDYQWIETTKYHRGCVLPNRTDTASLKFMAISSEAEVTGFTAGHDTQSIWSLIVPSEKSSVRGEDPSVKPAVYVFIITLVLSLPISYFVLWLLRTYTAELIYATLPFIVLIPLGISIGGFIVCWRDQQCKEHFTLQYQIMAFAFVLILCGIFIWMIWANWDRIELTIRIVRTATQALHRNLGLVLVLPGLSVVLLCYLIPAVIFMFYAFTNGKIIPNPELQRHPELHCGESGVDCCVWKPNSWVPWYLTFTAVSLLWAIMVISEVQVFTISGTVAQWYFAAPTSSLAGAKRRALRYQLRGNSELNLFTYVERLKDLQTSDQKPNFAACFARNAFGPSFGTVCFSGLVVTFVQMIRSAMDSSRSQGGNEGLMAAVVRACLECLLSAVEFLTKFTTNYAAITGAGFCASAFMTFDLLNRNLLSTVVVETVAGRLLGQTAFAVSTGYGLLVWGGLCMFAHGWNTAWAVSIAIFAFFLLFLVLFFFIQVLNNIVDTVYICYAMDKDHNVVSKTEVHDVLVLLPPAKTDDISLAVPR